MFLNIRVVLLDFGMLNAQQELDVLFLFLVFGFQEFNSTVKCIVIQLKLFYLAHYCIYTMCFIAKKYLFGNIITKLINACVLLLALNNNTFRRVIGEHRRRLRRQENEIH